MYVLNMIKNKYISKSNVRECCAVRKLIKSNYFYQTILKLFLLLFFILQERSGSLELFRISSKLKNETNEMSDKI